MDFQAINKTGPQALRKKGPAKSKVETSQVEKPGDEYLAAENQEQECGFGCRVGKAWRGITKPIKKGVGKAARAAKLAANGLVTAIQVAPTVMTLVAASAVSRVEGLLPGREKMSAIEYLRARSPGLFNHTINNVFDLVGDSTVNATGLSVDNLIEIQEHIYKSLAPLVGDDGHKKPAHFISQLANAPYREQDTPHAAFVYLGEGRDKESKELMRLWNSEEPPDSNPYEKTTDLHRVWEVLEEKVEEKKLPVFIDLDGDARTFTSTEYISKEIMNSMVVKHNDSGDGFQSAGLYYSWMATRQESFYDKLEPWMQQNRKLDKAIGDVKDNLTPPWLGGKEGLGPWPSPRVVGRAFDCVEELSKKSTKGAQGLADFSDAVVAMDQDVVTGTMTYWMKLLKETGGARRSKLFDPLAKAWVNTYVSSILNPEIAVPKGAPTLKALEGPPAIETERKYDRGIALGELVDHTLDGLGILERKGFMKVVKDCLRENLSSIQSQDDKFNKRFGGKYQGIDFAPVLADRDACDDEELKTRLEELRMVLHEGVGLSERELAELHRHHAMADWLINSQKRYGDVHFGLIGHAKFFKDHPLSVSQFFDQMEEPTCVTLLGGGPIKKVDDSQQKANLPKLNVSIFREGGGGKGMAYPTPTRLLKSGLTSINANFDDVGGNSAGSIPGLLEAAGYTQDEVEEISAMLDFKEFNADAIPLLGGTDPKIGGVNHTGLFSSQKMYKDLYGILSEKLGIEGRPILFRDLPKRLAVTATVMNTDLPDDDPLREFIDKDRRMVMSSENTPNFDVIGAITASTAVPAYFSAPQIQVARSEEKDGVLQSKHYRMQFVDGGVVDNFPISAAKRAEEGKTALVMVPAFYETIDPETGEKIGLSTLNFDDAHVAAVNEENKRFYKDIMPKLDKFLAKAADQGYSRVVVGMNLSDLDEQKELLIQGQSAEETDFLLSLADEEKLSHMDADIARDFMEGTVNSPSLGKKTAGAIFNLFMDGQSGEDNEFKWGFKGSEGKVGKSEEENLLEVIRASGSAALSTSEEQLEARLFEKPS